MTGIMVKVLGGEFPNREEGNAPIDGLLVGNRGIGKYHGELVGCGWRAGGTVGHNGFVQD